MVVQELLSLSDDEVVDRVRCGETGLYELLMRRYNQRLFRMIRSLITNDSDAEEILQETWVRVYEHLNQFEGRSSFATWATRIAYHEALLQSRKSKRWSPLETSRGESMLDKERNSTNAESPESQTIRGELGNILRSAIDSLPETYRSVFMLREVEQLSTAATAECLGLSEEAVKTRLHRSRALLRRDLTDRLGASVAEAYSFLGSRCDSTVAAVMARIGGSAREV
jgi:RNA polymerase sigma-70 factor (ECF subfamily)